MQANQQVTFVTDGADDVRDLPLYLNPEAEHRLDWFHVTMRLTVMTLMAKGLRAAPPDADLPASADLATGVVHELERFQWLLWHGNVFHALQTVEDLESELGVEDPHPQQRKLLKQLRECDTYIRSYARFIPKYGERYRAGEAIYSSFAESAVNQVVSKRMVKSQQMRWSPRGAHLLLQIRTRALNDDLADAFCRWYPGFTHTSEATLDDQQVAA
jgi:hypothetical protein